MTWDRLVRQPRRPSLKKTELGGFKDPCCGHKQQTLGYECELRPGHKYPYHVAFADQPPAGRCLWKDDQDIVQRESTW